MRTRFRRLSPAALRGRSALRRSLLGGCLLLALLLPAAASQADEDPPMWPGLPPLGCDLTHQPICNPDNPNTAGKWWGGAQQALAGSPSTRQWIRIPPTIFAINLETFSGRTPDGGAMQIPDAWAWMVSPDGAEHNYGMSPEIHVRTVAFGSIPVEATLQLTQLRDERGYPEPLHVRGQYGSRRLADGLLHTYAGRAYLNDQVRLHVRRLRVDGVDLRLRESCATRTPASLRMTSHEQVLQTGQSNPKDIDITRAFWGSSGGALYGDIDIPAFSGCATASGDDLSPLLTATISGSGNPVEIRIGMLFCHSRRPAGGFLPPAPGEDTPEEACFKLVPTNQVAPQLNPGLVQVPDPLPFPDRAPERTDTELPPVPNLP